MTATTSTATDAMLTAQMVTTTAVQLHLLSEIHSQHCALLSVPADTMEILFCIHVLLATTLVAHALLPLLAILVLLQATES